MDTALNALLIGLALRLTGRTVLTELSRILFFAVGLTYTDTTNASSNSLDVSNSAIMAVTAGATMAKGGWCCVSYEQNV